MRAQLSRHPPSHVLNHVYTWRPHELESVPATSRCSNRTLKGSAASLLMLMGPSGAGKTHFARRLIDSLPRSSWRMRSVGSCSWIEHGRVAILGHWVGFTDPESLSQCRHEWPRFCTASLTKGEGSDQLLRSMSEAARLRTDCTSALRRLYAKGAQLVLSDGISLLAPGNASLSRPVEEWADLRFLDQVEEAGFRVRLLEVAIDAATLHAQRVRREGEDGARRIERIETAGQAFATGLGRYLAFVRADRHWTLCTRAEIQHLFGSEPRLQESDSFLIPACKIHSSTPTQEHSTDRGEGTAVHSCSWFSHRSCSEGTLPPLKAFL